MHNEHLKLIDKRINCGTMQNSKAEKDQLKERIGQMNKPPNCDVLCHNKEREREALRTFSFWRRRNLGLNTKSQDYNLWRQMRIDKHLEKIQDLIMVQTFCNTGHAEQCFDCHSYCHTVYYDSTSENSFELDDTKGKHKRVTTILGMYI
jgi:hypothetical protein